MPNFREIKDKLTNGVLGEGAKNDNSLAGDDSTVSDIAAPSRTRADMAANHGLGRTTYIVQEGDTFASIASKCGISPTDLAGINNMVNPDVNLYPGRALIIPG